MNQYEIKIGIKTAGNPVIKNCENITILENMLIGDGFHWQKVIKAELPGEVTEHAKGRIVGEESENSRDNISLINTLPLETYLQCVVGSEMNPSSPVEFLKAHAVISRSWALGKILGSHPHGSNICKDEEGILIGWDDTGTHKGFHVCSDDHCQRYQGIQQISSVAMEAIRDTQGEVLMTKDNRVLDARFSKCCGGRTELFETCWQDESNSGLQSVEDPWCDLSKMPPLSRRTLLSNILKDYDLDTRGYGFSWKKNVTKKLIKRRLNECFNINIGDVKRIEAVHRGISGRIDLLRIEGTEGNINIGKELWIRRILSESHLYSSAIQIREDGERFILSGKGWGHGVGLCQIGAAHMAVKGFSYRDILSFYYPATTIHKI